MLKRIKSYMMPISMCIGIIFYNYLNILSVITPFLVALMLFISYSNISLRGIKIKKLHIWLLCIQLFGSFIIYSLASVIFNGVIAQGAMICILAPTATSAIVITGMLGGNKESLATYSLLSNFAVVIFAPLVFTIIGDNKEIPFMHSLWVIFEKVFLILLLPFVLNVLLRKISPVTYQFVVRKQSVSFYLWNMALMIVTAKTVKFIIDQGDGNFRTEITIAILAMFACVMQFICGWVLGRKYNDTIAGGQGLGQKNTVLAIWMSQTYLDPISSIGPGAYVLWQNIINSYQVWRKRKTIL